MSEARPSTVAGNYRWGSQVSEKKTKIREKQKKRKKSVSRSNQHVHATFIFYVNLVFKCCKNNLFFSYMIIIFSNIWRIKNVLVEWYVGEWDVSRWPKNWKKYLTSLH